MDIFVAKHRVWATLATMLAAIAVAFKAADVHSVLVFWAAMGAWLGGVLGLAANTTKWAEDMVQSPQVVKKAVVLNAAVAVSLMFLALAFSAAAGLPALFGAFSAVFVALFTGLPSTIRQLINLKNIRTK